MFGQADDDRQTVLAVYSLQRVVDRDHARLLSDLDDGQAISAGEFKFDDFSIMPGESCCSCVIDSAVELQVQTSNTQLNE